MNATISLSVRTVVVGLVVLLALVLAYLLGGSGGPAPATAAGTGEPSDAAAAPPARQLTTAGTGRSSAVPDQLSFALEVDLTRPELDDALEAANRSMTTVLGSLKKYGVGKADVQTTGLSMEPVYDYPSSGAPVLRGYQVSERASVLVDDLAKGGRAVTAAVAAGGNDVRVDNLQLLVGDTDPVMAQARDAAVEDARTKAEQYADASGQRLGDVVSISEVAAVPVATPVEPAAELEAGADRAAAVPIRAGEDEASVTVRIVWALE